MGCAPSSQKYDTSPGKSKFRERLPPLKPAKSSFETVQVEVDKGPIDHCKLVAEALVNLELALTIDDKALVLHTALQRTKKDPRELAAWAEALRDPNVIVSITCRDADVKMSKLPVDALVCEFLAYAYQAHPEMMKDKSVVAEVVSWCVFQVTIYFARTPAEPGSPFSPRKKHPLTKALGNASPSRREQRRHSDWTDPVNRNLAKALAPYNAGFDDDHLSRFLGFLASLLKCDEFQQQFAEHDMEETILSGIVAPKVQFVHKARCAEISCLLPNGIPKSISSFKVLWNGLQCMLESTELDCVEAAVTYIMNIIDQKEQFTEHIEYFQTVAPRILAMGLASYADGVYCPQESVMPIHSHRQLPFKLLKTMNAVLDESQLKHFFDSVDNVCWYLDTVTSGMIKDTERSQMDLSVDDVRSQGPAIREALSLFQRLQDVWPTVKSKIKNSMSDLGMPSAVLSVAISHIKVFSTTTVKKRKKDQRKRQASPVRSKSPSFDHAALMEILSQAAQVLRGFESESVAQLLNEASLEILIDALVPVLIPCIVSVPRLTMKVLHIVEKFCDMQREDAEEDATDTLSNVSEDDFYHTVASFLVDVLCALAVVSEGNMIGGDDAALTVMLQASVKTLNQMLQCPHTRYIKDDCEKIVSKDRLRDVDDFLTQNANAEIINDFYANLSLETEPKARHSPTSLPRNSPKASSFLKSSPKSSPRSSPKSSPKSSPTLAVDSNLTFPAIRRVSLTRAVEKRTSLC